MVAYQNGINVLPIAAGGSKHPPLQWNIYQHERVLPQDLSRWFLSARYPGLAFVTGAISRGLELLDFDDPQIYPAWCEQMKKQGMAALAEQIAHGYLEATPGGLHLLYRCQIVSGNQRLASRLQGTHHRRTLIETRGEGGLVIVAPSGSGIHPSEKPYRLLRGGISTIQVITPLERQRVLNAALALNELPHEENRQLTYPSREKSRQSQMIPGELRPGDLFNQYATWEEVLNPHGWRLLSVRYGEGYWTKHEHIHATTNYQGSDLLYVFSTATVFEPERGYTKFAAFTLLNYGDLSSHAFTAAARQLAQNGYNSTQ